MFSSQRKLFLKYNNPTSFNKGSLALRGFDKLYKNSSLSLKKNFNKNFNLFSSKNIGLFFNCLYKNVPKKIFSAFFKDMNVKFLYKLNSSSSFLTVIGKFFDFNLMDFYNLKNKFDSYKHVMRIESVYAYKFANNAFKTIDEFVFTIFKTPYEVHWYFNIIYKEYSFNIVYNIFVKMEKFFFLFDLFNSNNGNYIRSYSNIYRFFNKLSRIYMYTFNYLPFQNLMKNEVDENILKRSFLERFYKILSKKQLFYRIQKVKKRKFHRRKWSIENFFNILKYNSMFYLDINSISILFNGWLYEIMFFSRFMMYTKVFNDFMKFKDLYNYNKYIVSLRDFFFQLMYENVDYVLIFIIMNFNRIYNMVRFNFVNNKNMINYNFIYRKYMAYTWLEYEYYNDVFSDLEKFKSGVYSTKLSKWILRYFYKKAELHEFYSESLVNNYRNKERIL